jgi:hypothetical protein
MRSAAMIAGMPWREPLRVLGPRSPSAPWSGSRSHRTSRWSSFRLPLPSCWSSDRRKWSRRNRALIGGHIGATLVGLAVLHVTGPHAWAAAAAVGLAVLAMYVTGTFHPPAGINPLLVVPTNLPCGAGRGRSAGCDGHRASLSARRYSGLTSSTRFCSANRSPSRASSTLRWWKASSVER